MTFEQAFTNLKELFAPADASNFKGKLAYQINIKGEGEGTFYVEIIDDKITIEPYDYKDNDAELTISYKDLVGMIKGEKDSVKLFLTGKLKINGSIEKAKMIENFYPKG
ncbi:MAG: SCP2 sterol-binding domain-containing protein [Oscillospiraceae bacterium]|nr:SCP2 sterol-binding domain-containing protein [Oscillospiraceae bacterium]